MGLRYPSVCLPPSCKLYLQCSPDSAAGAYPDALQRSTKESSGSKVLSAALLQGILLCRPCTIHVQSVHFACSDSGLLARPACAGKACCPQGLN